MKPMSEGEVLLPIDINEFLDVAGSRIWGYLTQNNIN